MARARSSSTSAWVDEHKNYLLPSLLGGVVAWGFSGDVMIGVWVFLAVWIGNWFGASLRGRK